MAVAGRVRPQHALGPMEGGSRARPRRARTLAELGRPSNDRDVAAGARAWSRMAKPDSCSCGRRSSSWPVRPRVSSTRARSLILAQPCGAATAAARPAAAARGVELAYVWRDAARGTRQTRNSLRPARRPRTILLSGVDSLTASERRVAQMAAEEMSNKEIAQALFVTVRRSSSTSAASTASSTSALVESSAQRSPAVDAQGTDDDRSARHGRSPRFACSSGRRRLAALEAMLAAARVGDGRLVVVEGSAGIGKTRLLAEARALAQAAEFEVLSARGGELEGEFAFGIVRQLFEAPLAAATPGAARRAACRRGRAERVPFRLRAHERVRRGSRVLVRDAARPLLADRELRVAQPDAARRRRPALGRRAVAALASLLVPPA